MIETQVEVTPRRDHVVLFDLGGGREDHVGEASGVGHELFGHHGEQIVTLEATRDGGGLGCGSDRIAVVDEESFHGRIEIRIGERSSDLIHADRTTEFAGCELWRAERVVVEERVVVRTDAARETSALVLPRPGESGQTHERAEELRAVFAMLGADQGANERLLSVAVVTGQLLDHIGIDSAHRRCAGRGPVGHVSHQFVESGGVALHVVVIDQIVADEDVHHGEHESHVGSG